MPSPRNPNNADGDDANHPADGERRPRDPCPPRAEHKDHGDDRDRAQGDSDRARQELADRLAHRRNHVTTLPTAPVMPVSDARARRSVRSAGHDRSGRGDEAGRELPTAPPSALLTGRRAPAADRRRPLARRAAPDVGRPGDAARVRGGPRQRPGPPTQPGRGRAARGRPDARRHRPRRRHWVRVAPTPVHLAGAARRRRGGGRPRDDGGGCAAPRRAPPRLARSVRYRDRRHLRPLVPELVVRRSGRRRRHRGGAVDDAALEAGGVARRDRRCRAPSRRRLGADPRRRVGDRSGHCRRIARPLAVRLAEPRAPAGRAGRGAPPHRARSRAGRPHP